MHARVAAKEVINNTRCGIECKIWEGRDGGQIQDLDVHFLNMMPHTRESLQPSFFPHIEMYFSVKILKMTFRLYKRIKKYYFVYENRKNDLKQRRGKYFIQISAVV